MADLKPRQYKRLGRIAENNPERATRVAGRMEKRASREERGREVAGNTGRGVSKYRAASEVTRAEENPRAREEARKKINEFAKESENYVKKTKRPDTPLAASPVPSFLKNR